MNRHLTLKCTPVPPWGAPAGTPAHYHGGYEPVDSLITPTVTQGEHLGDTYGVLRGYLWSTEGGYGLLCVFICAFSYPTQYLVVILWSPTRYSVGQSQLLAYIWNYL